MEKMNDAEKNKIFLDIFLDIFGGENGLTEMRILKMNRDNDKLLRKILNNTIFIKLDEDNVLKQSLLKDEQEFNKLLNNLCLELEKYVIIWCLLKVSLNRHLHNIVV